MWYFGEMGEKNLQKAWFYFKKAADKNYPQSQYNLAGMLYYGEGVDENKSAAMQLFRKSAENGFAASWISLGEFYSTGEVVSKDIDKAMEYFNLASDHGLGEADYLLSRIFESEPGYEDSVKREQYLTRSLSRGYKPEENK
jgi:TPR repeat protein